MSRLATVIRLRRRQLDALRLAIGSEQAEAQSIAAAASTLEDQRHSERLLGAEPGLSADAWFEAAARRLDDFAAAHVRSLERLGTLRSEAGRARARLSLLEEAETEQLAAERRAAEKKAQASLDDRSAMRRGGCR